MKKVLVVALAALLILALFIPAMADSNPTLTTTVGKTTVKRGEEVAVSLVLDKNVSTRNIGIRYELDKDVFAYKNKSGKWSNEIKMNGLDADVFTATAGEGEAVFAADPAIDVSAGVIFTVTFTVKDDAPFGTYQIKMVSGEQFPATCVAATVTVTHDCVPSANFVNTDAAKHWKTCTVAGCDKKFEEGNHIFDNACDTTCDTCGYTRTTTHDYSNMQKNDTEHWFLCTGCGAEEPGTRAAHSGGTATCKEKAVCTVCSTAYGTVLAHTPAPESEDIQVAPADCATPAQYKKKCSACGDPFGDAFPKGTPDASLHSGGTATCTAKAVCQHCHQPYGTIDPNNHVGTKKVEKSATEHWEVCQACFAEVAGTRAAHTGGTATCVDKKVCTVCSQAYGTVDAAAHTGATKTEKNDTEHWEVCQACFAEVAGTRAAHTGGTATCVDKKVCTVCSQAYGTVDAANHTGATKTEKNDTEHWTVCQSCTTEIAGTRAAHTGGTATCVDKKVCTVCAQAYGTVDPANHTGNKDVVPAEPSTCTTLGKKEGTKCHDCGEILSQEPETELAPHFVEEWTEVKPASETEEGEKKGKCTECGQEFTVKTAKLAAALKPENVEAPQGSKVELGETKLPEDTGLDVEVLTPELLTALEQNLGEFTKDIPEAAGKNVIAATSVMFLPNITFTDIASGDTVVDNDYQEKLPGKVKVTASVPADLSNYENLVILLVEGEKVTKINATIENGVVVYESDTANGGIIVLGTQKKAPVVPETSTPAGEGAQTGDASQVVIFISLAIVSVLSLGGIYVSKKARASK